MIFGKDVSDVAPGQSVSLSGGGDGFDGVHVFAPDGTRIGQILLPEECANLTFGGRRRTRLFMTASQSVYSVYVRVRGLG